MPVEQDKALHETVFQAIRDNHVDVVLKTIKQHPHILFTKVSEIRVAPFLVLTMFRSVMFYVLHQINTSSLLIYINSRFNTKRTLLYTASFYGRYELVRLFIDHGADRKDELDSMKVHALLGGEYSIWAHSAIFLSLKQLLFSNEDISRPRPILVCDSLSSSVKHALPVLAGRATFRVHVHFNEPVQNFTQDDFNLTACVIDHFVALRSDYFITDMSVMTPEEHNRTISLIIPDAIVMSLYTLKQLFNDCSSRLSRTKCAADKKRETLEDIWRAFNDWIDSRFDAGKGVHVATFATISWETCTNSRNQPKLRPVFILSDTYLKTYGLQQKKPIAPPMLASLEDINFTKIAIKFSKNLTKDLVFSGIRDMLQKIGEVSATGGAVSIAFNFGRLIAKNRCVSVIFDPLKFPRALEDQITRSMISSPPSVLGNLTDFDIPPEDTVNFNDVDDWRHFNKDRGEAFENGGPAFPTDGQEALPTHRSNPDNVISSDLTLEEELQMYDVKHSPLKENPVIESAFRRHIVNLAEEVDREAKYAFDQQLQQKRDIETVALENKMRRLCAEDLQRHLLSQMEQRRQLRIAEKQEHRNIDPSASSFYSESELERLGHNDKEYLLKSKQFLKDQLQEQMHQKEQERLNDRQRNLLDDKQFLRRLRGEMNALEQKQQMEREERRRVLTEAWNRDSVMKKLVEAKKKQRAVEQIHREGVAMSPAKTNYYPNLPQPATPPRQLREDDDYSVGFDIRSICE
ncbi:TPA: hypothetical protein N0F65_008317 [Lagenidium giganteum]|uniref:Uncharacterized protein n=1 Tax=Lagenidium giganteum TaxID=4803 RepID=A0AAV2YUK9_9STRA|nr:TPA: hypothetical protein N0F65_008317 [Lagenidium giganteum]